jgi:hypothetical protein
MRTRVIRIMAFCSILSSIETATPGNLRGEVESIIKQAGMILDQQEVKTCSSRTSQKDCHSASDDARCVYCPTSTLKSSLIEADGICLPASVFALACPKTSRTLLSQYE